MRICVFGAGAIGGFVAARLAQVPGLELSVVARGAHLAAIRSQGLRLRTPQGETVARVYATDTPEELGVQDIVFIAPKQHQLTPALPGLQPLLWPVAVLTGATLDRLTTDPDNVALVRRMMEEADALAAATSVPRLPIGIDERIAAARNAGAHKMSMLQDVERGRPPELAVLSDSLQAMRELTGVATPTRDGVHALLRLRLGAAG